MRLQPCSNTQFSSVKTIMQSMKKDPSTIYMVPDQKQKVLQMIYQEGQVDYYGKKSHGFVGNYGDKLEILWGCQWVCIFIC